MKALCPLLIILFLINYSTEDCNSIPAKTRADCINATLEKNEKKCCYVEFKYQVNFTEENKTEEIYCRGFNEEEYEKMRETFRNNVTDINKTHPLEYAEIDCRASYIIVSMLSLILLLL